MKERVYTLVELKDLSYKYLALFDPQDGEPSIGMFIGWLRDIEILEEGREFLGEYLTRGRVNDV